ncbi:MAG: hypothetical protein GY847_42025 [Proteobacteria bacterium]|nr:hypothetical protein [Pseudomonadota bacterium]
MTDDSKKVKPPQSAEELLRRYAAGERDFTGANLEGRQLPNAKLEGANLSNAKLEGADLSNAKLVGVHFTGSNLANASMAGSSAKGAWFINADLKGVDLVMADLRDTTFWDTQLDGADLSTANLEGANLSYSHAEGVNLESACLYSANFDFCTVDGRTVVSKCKIDKETSFVGVGLGNVCIDPGLKQVLEYNMRRKRWEGWYTECKKNRQYLRLFLTKLFWKMSDYGTSTGQIAKTFFVSAAAFAYIYLVLHWFGHTVVANLGITESTRTPFWLVEIFRSVYFSIVTMTTLGFGDMYAHSSTITGHVLLTVQVLLGYIMLAALVTRFAVLFTSGGPSASFGKSSMKKTSPKKKDK